MSRSSLVQTLSLFLALGASTLAHPRAQGGHHGHGPHVVTIELNAAGVPTKTLDGASSVASPPASTTPTTTPITTQAAVAVSPASSSKASGTATGNGAPAPSPPSGGGSGDASGRRGIAFNSSSPDLDIFNAYPNVGWGVDWDSARAQLPGQYMFVPQLWGDAPDHTNNWVSNVEAANPSYVLSFNEPDQAGQATMGVPQAVSSHIQWMNPRSNGGNVKIGSVSVTNGGAPMGLTYLGDFLTQCAAASPACTVDFVQVHWYGCTNGCSPDQDVGDFKDHMTQALTTANGMDVWITEFQHFGSEQDQQSFISKALEWLDDPAQSKIAKYAYFMALDGILTTGGSLNTAGTAYAS